MERLTSSNEEIKTLQAKNATYWLKVYFKLKEYEDAEEQGLLIRLPCKPETKLYWLSDEGDGYEPIEELDVVDFLYNG